jgi:hypothetical protein
MRGEGGKRCRQVRLSTPRTGDSISIATHQLLKLRAAIITNVLVNRHGSGLQEYSLPSNSIAQVCEIDRLDLRAADSSDGDSSSYDGVCGP